MSKNIIFNYSLETYKKKYRNNRYKLLSFSKKEIEEFNKKKKNKNIDFLLKNRKWALIGDTYYEIPKAPRWIWFRNLNSGLQFTAISLTSIGLVSAAVFPALFATIWKPITAGVSEKLKEDVEIKTKEKLIVGESATIELTIKDKSKDTKQLPSDPEQITVTTGGVKLDYWQKPTTITNTISNSKCTSYADSIVNDDPSVEPENYYSYYYTKDKAELYIKKVLGPIVVDMVLEDRSYTVTFNPRNEVDSSTSIEVLRGAKIKESQKPTIEDNDYRVLDAWYATGSSEAFDFNKEIYADVTLNAKYNSGTKTGVYIKGLKGIEQDNRYFEDVNVAYNTGRNIVKDLYDISDEQTFKNIFDDYVVVQQENGQNKYFANITWYVFGDINFDRTNYSMYHFSFGRSDRKLGDNFALYNTNVEGITKDAKINTWHRFYSMDNSKNDIYKTPFNFKNVELKFLRDETTGETDDFVFFGQASNVAGSEFVLNIDNCKLDDILFVSQSNTMNINVQNSTFEFDNDYSYAIEIDDEASTASSTRVDKLVLKNNTFNGGRKSGMNEGGYYKCINLNSRYLQATIENNKFNKVHTNGEGKIGNSVIQISQANKVEIIGNDFEECGANVFMIHEDLPTTSSGVSLKINNNILNKCGYVGVNETGDSTVYNLESSGNKVTDTKENACGLDTLESTDSRYIFHIGH